VGPLGQTGIIAESNAYDMLRPVAGGGMHALCLCGVMCPMGAVVCLLAADDPTPSPPSARAEGIGSKKVHDAEQQGSSFVDD
jgi:hypothetical protein